MKKQVLIHILGTQVDGRGEEDIIDLTTVGIMHQGPTSIQLIYEESDISGLQGTNTSIAVEGERVTVKRTGTVEMTQVFERGLGNLCRYVTPIGTLDLEVLASKVEVDLTAEGGNITIEYELFSGEETGGDLEMPGMESSKISDNRLRISVREAKGK